MLQIRGDGVVKVVLAVSGFEERKWHTGNFVADDRVTPVILPRAIWTAKRRRVAFVYRECVGERFLIHYLVALRYE